MQPADREPISIRAGVTTIWRREWPTMRPPEWDLDYRIIFPAGVAYSVPVIVDGTGYLATIPPPATLPAGPATLYGTMKDGSDVISVYAGRIEILQDLSTVANIDPRSSAEIALADAEAALAKYLNTGAQISQWTINGKTMQFRSAADIIALVNHYRQIVARECIASAIQAGGAPGRIITRQC